MSNDLIYFYRPYEKPRKLTKTNQEEIMNIINPSNYVKKNKIIQSYSVISQQNPTNSPLNPSTKKTELLVGDADHTRPPVMIKSYDIHLNNQFGFNQISDKYVKPIK